MFPGGWVRLLIRITLLLSLIIVVSRFVPAWPLSIPLVLVCVDFQRGLKSLSSFRFFTRSSPDLQDPSSKDLDLRVEIVVIPGDGCKELVGIVYVVPAFIKRR